MKTLSSFKELRGFLILWSSQTVSELGTAMTDYALIVWTYGRTGTASSVTLLTLCVFMPTILFRFMAGALVDRWDKKRVMLVADTVAACGTAAVLALHAASALRLWHVCLINVLMSCMNAFQVPASFVATSLLVPKEHYARVGGLQGFSGAAVSILAPALGSALLAFGGLEAVLACDLASFAVAFLALLFCVSIPKAEPGEKGEKEPFLESCANGIRYLRGHAAIWGLTLFLAAVNLLAKLGNDGMIAPYVLARTGNDQRALGMVQSSVAVGLLAGSLVMTFSKPVGKRSRVIFVTCAIVFAGNVVQGLSRQPYIWCAAAFAAYMMAAIMNGYLTMVMRERVPVGMQGRVFSAKDTLQNCTIPLGLFLGGLLADRVFEPLMAADSPVQRSLSRAFGSGGGAGIGVMFVGVGMLGMFLALTQLANPVYRELDE